MKKYSMLFVLALLISQSVSRPQTGGGGTTGGASAVSTFNWQTPTTGDSGKWQAYFYRPVAIAKVYCSTDGLGTVSINLQIRPDTSPNTTGTTVLSAPITCTGTGASTATILNNSIPASSSLGYLVTPIVTATTGSAGIVRVAVVTQ